MKVDPDAPAYPYAFNEEDVHGRFFFGLTIRTELAARAMQGIMSNLQVTYALFQAIDSRDMETALREYMAMATATADALIAELNKEQA